MNDEFKPFPGAQAEFIESDNSINVYFSSTKIYEAVKKVKLNWLLNVCSGLTNILEKNI